MIDKVANERNPQWAQPQDDSFTRDSISKSSMDAFTLQLSLQAKTAAHNGHSPEHIAVAMKLPVEMVNDLIAMEIPKEKERRARMEEAGLTKVASTQETEEEQEKREKETHLNAAEEAYNQLHGKRAQTALKNPILANSKSVPLSRKGDIEETGGPKKYMKYDSANSIWNSEILKKNLEQPDNGERIREENAKIAAQREDRRQAQCHITKDAFLDALAQTETRKDNSTYSYHVSEAHNYNGKLQKKGISIFDGTKENPFVRIAEKTDGELSSEASRNEKSGKKDRSWAVQSAPKNTKSVFDKMVDNFLEQE